MWAYLHNNAIRQTFQADISFCLLTGKATYLMKIKGEYHFLLNRVQEQTKTDPCDVSHLATAKRPIKLPLKAMNESRCLNNHIYIDNAMKNKQTSINWAY